MKKTKKIITLALTGFLGVILMSTGLLEKEIHIEGTLVDSKCYSMMPKANASNDHMVMGHDGKLMEVKSCATACANMGIPVGVLDKKGKMHVLAVPASQLAPHMAKEVRVDGKAMNGVVIVDKLEVKEGNKWTEVKIVVMM